MIHGSVRSRAVIVLTSLLIALGLISPVVASAQLSSLTLSPVIVMGGANSTATVVLTAAAPTGGALISLTSTPVGGTTSFASVPPVLLIPAGQTTGTFLIATGSPSNGAVALISASYSTASLHKALSIESEPTQTLSPTADASVQAGANANTNYGSAALLLVDKSSADNTNNNNAVTYLKFDLTTVHAPPAAATLKLMVNAASSPTSGISPVNIYAVSNTTWTQNAITWNNAPGLNANVTSSGTLLTSQAVPLEPGVAAFDVTSFVKANLGQIVTLQVIDTTLDHNSLAFDSTNSSSPPTLVLTSPFLNDIPPPLWAMDVVPRDTAAFAGAGPSATDTVNLASGVEENYAGPDLSVYNPVGPAAVFSRMYRTAQANLGYASPGLTPGWTHNFDVTAQGFSGNWLPITLHYPNGGSEQWMPVTNNGNPTGVLTLPKGTPYSVIGQPSATVGQWVKFVVTFKDNTTWTLTPSSGSPNLYQLTKVTNQVGHAITVSYYSNTEIHTIANDAKPAVTLMTFHYGSNLNSLTDCYGRTITYGYQQPAGLPTCLYSVSQINSTTALQFTYGYQAINAAPLLNSVSQPDPTGNGVTMVSHAINYDLDGRASKIVTAENNKREYLYTNTSSTSVTVLDSTGNLDDSFSQIVGGLNEDGGSTDADHHTQMVTYGDQTNPYRPTIYTNRNNQTVNTTYDAFGNPLTVIVPCNGGHFTTTYDYDYTVNPLGRLTTIDGITLTTLSYYPNGLVNTITTPDPSDQYGTVATTYTYTALGNVKTVTMPAPNNNPGNGQIPYATIQYTYSYTDGGKTEALGQPTSITDPLSHKTQFKWDSRGNLTAVIDPLGNETDYTPNLADQLTSTIYPATGQTGTGRAHVDTTYLYLNGPATSVVAYDESGNPVRTAGMTLGKEGEAKADTGSTEQDTLGYDGANRILTLADANQHSFGHTYDPVGNLTKLAYPLNDSVSAGYDTDSNLISFTNVRQQLTQFSLAPDDSRVTNVTFADNSQYTYQYDQFGRVESVTDGQTTLIYDYDASSGFLMSVDTQYAALAQVGLPDLTISYVYYPDGSLSSVSDGGGSFIYQYDNAGHMTQVNFPWADFVTYDYDGAGRLKDQYTGQSTSTYQYNAANQIIDLAHYSILPGYDWPTDNNLFFEFSSPSNTIPMNMYDGAGNLLGANFKYMQPDGSSQYGMGSISYQYDTQDHLTQETATRNIVTVNGNVGNVNYAHGSDLADNLTELRGITFNSNADDQITSDGQNDAFANDADGNFTAFPEIYADITIPMKASYDTQGRMISYGRADGTGTQLTFGYRPDGLRAWRKDQQGYTYFYVYAGTQLLDEVIYSPNDSYTPTVLRQYGWGAAGLVELNYAADIPALNIAGGIDTYLYDLQGNTLCAFYSDTSNSYQDPNLLCYDAFGSLVAAVIWQSDSLFGPPGPVGWGGQWGAYTDPLDFDLILCGYRYYNPGLGRFLTRDPSGYDGGINLYSYTRNNPVNSADPMGLDRDVPWWKQAGQSLLGAAKSAGSWLLAAPGKLAWGAIKKLTAVKMNPGTPTLGHPYIDPDLPESAEVNGRYVQAGRAVNQYINQTGEMIAGTVILSGKLGSMSNLSELEMLNLKLGSEELVSSAMAGQGDAILGAGSAKALRDAPRLAAQYGGDAEEWAKMTTTTRSIRGIKYSLHYYRNPRLNLNVEPKTIIGR